MVTFITGRSGVGKTEYLMERLPALAKEYGKVYFLVPEQSSMGLERRIGALGADGVKVVSFRRLCNEIFRAFGGVAGSYMSAAREVALIYRVLQEQQKNLRYYKDARPSMGFVSRLSEVFGEFALAGLEQEAVLPLLEKSDRPDWQDKYHDLFLLYNAYRATLDQESRSAAEDIAAATEIAREKGFFDGCAVVLDGFFGFTGRQRELLKVIFDQSAAVCCALLMDEEAGSLLFEPIQKEYEALCRIAGPGRYQRVHLSGPSKRLAYEDLRLLERRLFTNLAKPFEADHIRLMNGRNIREELSMVAADIARKVRSEGYRYKEIALIAGSLDEYGPVAENIFQKYGIPLFLDRGRASLGKPVFAFVQSALRIISPERYFRQEDVLAFLKTGLCGEDRDLISRLENYCTLWQMSGERFAREADWTQNPNGTGSADARASALLSELNALRRRVVAPLLRFKAAAGKTGATLAEAIYQLLCDFKVAEQMAAMAENYRGEEGANPWETHQNRRLSREYMKLYGTLTDILDDIHAVFADAPLSIYAMEELIGLCGEQTALNVAPPTQDAVLMGEVAHSRPEGVRALYVVGANQGILPVPAGDSGLIADRERQFFTAADLPCNATMQQHNLQGQHRLYAALFSAEEGLTFSFSSFNMKGDPLIPSLYIDRIKALTDLTPILRSDMDLYDFALTPDGARELIGWEPALQQAILDALGEKIPAAREKEERLPSAVCQKIFGDRLRLSYSQISTYQNCPFQYFMEKTMKIQPVEPITFDAANIGTFVHHGMEKLVQQIIAEGYDYEKYDRAEILRFGKTMAEEYLSDQLKDFNRTARFDALFERMTALFCRVAENVLGEFKEGRYRPVGTEESINGLQLPLAGGGLVELSGSVDRVDLYQEEGKTYLKVTDYKTGKKSFDMKGITNRDNVQLPIYFYGLIKSGKYQNPIPAAGCYMEAHTPEFDERFAPEELEQKIRHFYRRHGLISSDEKVLSALDAAKGSNYFKIDYKKDGDFTHYTRLYEPETVEAVTAHMETVLKETAQNILAGDVRVLPLKGKTPDACTYCDYKNICGFDANTDPRREYSEDADGWREEAQQ